MPVSSSRLRVAFSACLGVLAFVFVMVAQTGRAAAQASNTHLRSVQPLLSGVATLELEAGSPKLSQAARPSFVAPLILTVSGASIGAGALLVGLLGTMGNCGTGKGTGSGEAGTPPRTEAPGTGSTAVSSRPSQCDRSIETPFIVTAAVAGGVGVLGGIWLVERLVARGAYNREVRQQRVQVRVVPTFGGAALFGRF